MTRFAPIDLSQLPAPEVIEPLDFETIFAELRDQVIAAAPELAEALALESEPATKVLQVWAWSKLHDRARVNDAARAVMLPYATGADLEVLAALFGVTRAPDEPDDRLRERTRLVLQAYSSAGPAGAYRYFALSAHPDVIDAHVDSPAPGEVRVVVLQAGTPFLPDPAVTEAVVAAVNADDVRVLTDNITVITATPVPYTIDAELEISGVAAELALQAARAAVEAVVAARYRLGRRVTRSSLIAALHVDGVDRVTLTAPAADIEPAAHEVAVNQGITLAETGATVPQ